MEESNNNSLIINVIAETDDPDVPNEAFVCERLQRAWQALPENLEKSAREISVSFVDQDRITTLNNAFFNKDKPTNVLAFPYQGLPDIPSQELGDIIICLPVVREESERFALPFENRLVHMLIHALLHLMGYDHIKEQDRHQMERLEKDLLAEQGYPDPYES